MNFFDLPVLSALLAAATAALAVLGTVVTPGGAIVLVTLAVRAALIPVGISVARAERSRRRLAPRIAELQKRWRRNPEMLRRETMALYAAEKISPFAGCLPALAQAPVLTLVYAAFASPTVGGLPNQLLGSTLFGAPLGRHLTDLATAIVPSDLVFVPVIAVLMVVAIVGRRAALRAAANVLTTSGPLAGQAALITRMSGVAPFLTVVAAVFVPLAASVYLATTTSWSLGERALLRKFVINRG